MAILAALMLLGACQLPNRNVPETFDKPAGPPDVDALVYAMSRTVSDPWSATYVIRGAAVTSSATVIYQYPKVVVSTSLGGITPTVYATLEPASATACAQTGETFIGCFPISLENTGDSQRSTTELAVNGTLSPETELKLRQLLSVSGTATDSRQIAGTDADCIVAAPTEISPHIELCLARQGGLLFYSNGDVLIQATSYSNSIDPASLEPPGGEGLSTLLQSPD